MNNKGVFFSAITLLFILVLFGLITVLNNSLNQSGTNFNELFSIKSVSNKFDSVNSNIAELNISPNLMPIYSRHLPFDYTIDDNILYLSHQFPIQNGELELFYDVVNAYSIFISDQNAQNAYDGTPTQITPAKNANWGGSNRRLYFGLLPQCMQLLFIDGNKQRLNHFNSNHCETAFDSSEMTRFDLNVFIQYITDDFNSVTCSFDGSGTCPSQAFDVNNTLPYLDYRILDSNCSNCAIPSASKHIYGHYDPSKINSISLTCTGSNCTVSDQFKIYIGEGIQMDYNGNPLLLSYKTQFKQKVASFYFQDLNIIVQKPEFGAAKTRTE